MNRPEVPFRTAQQVGELFHVREPWFIGISEPGLLDGRKTVEDLFQTFLVFFAIYHPADFELKSKIVIFTEIYTILMKEKSSALYSKYVIDGIQQSLSPAAMLDECLLEPRKEEPAKEWEPVADETIDPSPSTYHYDSEQVDSYLKGVLACPERTFPTIFSAAFTRSRIARTLLDALWLRGRFRLEDLALRAEWKWNTRELGNLAAFYDSAAAAADYIDSLGLGLSRYSFAEADACSVTFKAGISRGGGEPAVDEEEMEEGAGPRMGRLRAIPGEIVPDKDSWLIYIPFDTSSFRLGGSLLAQTIGTSGNACPELLDADYLIDCYEVVRELVEDGILLSGSTVSDGGMLTALRRMCTPEAGADISIRDIMNAYNESGMVRILFAEVPGVIIQIRDSDYDYVDAELLLQDVAYYPLGHPVPGKEQVFLDRDGGNPITAILQSLLAGGASEGED